MSKRIKPKVEHRIVEGEVVSESIDEKMQRAQAFSAAKEAEYQAKHNAETEGESAVDESSPYGTNAFSTSAASNNQDIAADSTFIHQYKGYILWVLMFVVVILVLILTRPDASWQIQRINDLQSEVAQLHQQNRVFEARITEQESSLQAKLETKLESILSSQQGEAIVSQADLDALQKQLQQKLTLLQGEFSGLSEQAAIQVDKALADIKSLSQSAQTTLAPSKEQVAALSDLEKKLQNELGAVSQKLDELFDFKQEQQTLSKQPPVLKLDMPLDSLQIQQWIVEVNTQWILNGRINETRQQLLALEQAASLSDFTYTTHLARLIGQDLGYLKQLEVQYDKFPVPDTSALKQAARELITIMNSDKQQPLESLSSEKQGLDGLIDKFSRMITLKKRPEEGEITTVDTLLIGDVLQQRLALLIDRLDWGLQSYSIQTVSKAMSDIKAFIKRYYEKDVSKFNRLLEPFEGIQFPSHQSLSIVRMDEEING